MSRWMRQLAERMSPMWEALLEKIKAYPYVQVDETPFQVFKIIKRIYRIESELRESAASVEQVVAIRQERTQPLLEALLEQLIDLRLKTSPKGYLGQAVAYALTQWPRLQKFLNHGEVKPDTIDVENAIRPFVVGRKAWSFAGSPAGAEASALLYSLVEMA